MRLTRHEKTPAVVTTEIGMLDLICRKLNRWPKEGDTVETGDWQSYMVFAGYPQMVEVKKVMVCTLATEWMNNEKTKEQFGSS